MNDLPINDEAHRRPRGPRARRRVADRARLVRRARGNVQPPGQGSGRCRFALVVLCAAEILVFLVSTIVTVALPSIQRALAAETDDLQWIVTAFTLPFGAFLLVSGRAGDLYGRRRILVAGLVVFSAASLGAGLADSFAHLVVARAVQGVGAALAIPATLALLTDTFRQERQRQQALGLLSMTLDVTMVVGLVLGGLLTASAGWRWCFLVVVPFGLLAAVLAPVALEESREPSAPSPDALGAVLAASGFGLLTFGVVRVEHTGLASLLPSAAGAALIAGFLLRQRTCQEPVLRLTLFRHRPLTGANLANAANAGGFTGLMFLTTLYLQQHLALAPLAVGLAFIPLALSSACGGLIAPRLVARLGPRRTATTSLAFAALSFGWLAHAASIGGHVPVLLPAFVLAGFSFAATFVPLTSQAMTGIRPSEHGLASGVFQTSTHLGGALILATLATIAAAASPDTAAHIEGTGFITAFLTGAIILAAGAVVAASTIPARPTTSPDS